MQILSTTKGDWYNAWNYKMMSELLQAIMILYSFVINCYILITYVVIL